MRMVSKRKRAKQKLDVEELKVGEQNFSSLANAPNVGIYRLDTCGRFVFINKFFAKLFGYKQNELRGKNWRNLNLLPSHTQQQVEENFKKLLSGNSVQGEIVCKRKDGLEFVVSFSAVPIKRRGKVIGITGTLTDITEHKMAEESLQRSEQKYRALYDCSPELCRTINTDGIILNCNKRYEDSLGYSREELIGTSIFDHVAEYSMEPMRESFEIWKKTGHVQDREVWLQRKDRTTFPVLISANNLYDETGELIGSNTILKDMSEIYRVRRELEIANVKLRQKDRLKDEFISVASHELKTPVQPIMGALDLMEKGYMDKATGIQQIRKHAKRIQQLAHNILDVSRLDSGQLSYEMERVGINELILDVVNSSEISLTRDLRIGTRLDDNVAVNADRGRIMQLLTNIIGNAIKFTKKGTITVETKVLQDRNKLQIKISDTGTGIPNYILPNIFDKFVTGGHNAAEHEGSGLGLYISKAIVTAHKGEISAHNNREGGAVFIILLPIDTIYLMQEQLSGANGS